MIDINEKISEYIEKYSTQEDEVLKKITRNTHLYQTSPHMLSGHIQGKFLEFISFMLTPSKVLEIGTFTAYSTVCLAKGLEENGKIVTIEQNPELEMHIREHLELSGISECTELIIGNALEIIPQLDEQFDLIFLDADKENYPNYIDIIAPKLKINGYIIADNVLWYGKVVEEIRENDKSTAAIAKFNTLISESPKFENVILPFRDGLNLIRKLKN